MSAVPCLRTVHRVKLRVVAAVLVVLGLALAGCASLQTAVAPDVDLTRHKIYFVEQNRTDDHHVASMISESLRARGLQVTHGPITMLPLAAEVIISYEDRWTWDFRTHMIGLRLTLRNAESGKALASATFDGATVLQEPNEVIARLIDKLFARPRG